MKLLLTKILSKAREDIIQNNEWYAMAANTLSTVYHL